jgi:dTDP-4-dehydrorhamnose 3,5-epimerase
VIIRDTDLPGLRVIELEASTDERGSFARTFDAAEWESRGMSTRVEQCSLSRNALRGTLRGMHYQAAPFAECKLVRCGRGAIFDVAVDLRPDSPGFRRWFGVELSESNDTLLYIPEGLAHGFFTLTDDSEVLYQISERYSPEHSRGVRWDDPAFGIAWPDEPRVISDRDRAFADFTS